MCREDQYYRGTDILLILIFIQHNKLSNMDYKMDLEVFQVQISNGNIFIYDDTKLICVYYNTNYIVIRRFDNNKAILLLTDKIHLLIVSRWIFSIVSPLKNVLSIAIFNDQIDPRIARLRINTVQKYKYEFTIEKISGNFSQKLFSPERLDGQEITNFELIHFKYEQV